jgi:hypothetical protein
MTSRSTVADLCDAGVLCQPTTATRKDVRRLYVRCRPDGRGWGAARWLTDEEATDNDLPVYVEHTAVRSLEDR